MKKRKTALALLLGSVFTATGKMPAGSGTTKRAERRRTTNPLQHSSAGLAGHHEKLATLQQATKRHVRGHSVRAREKLYPLLPPAELLDAAGRAVLDERQKPCSSTTELDYNLQQPLQRYRAQPAGGDFADQRRATETLAQHYGVMFFYRGQDPIDGQLVQVIKNFRETYHLSVIPVSVDGIVNPPCRIPEWTVDWPAGWYFVTSALMLADPKSGGQTRMALSADDLGEAVQRFHRFAPTFNTGRVRMRKFRFRLPEFDVPDYGAGSIWFLTLLGPRAEVFWRR